MADVDRLMLEEESARRAVADAALAAERAAHAETAAKVGSFHAEGEQELKLAHARLDGHSDKLEATRVELRALSQQIGGIASRLGAHVEKTGLRLDGVAVSIDGLAAELQQKADLVAHHRALAGTVGGLEARLVDLERRAAAAETERDRLAARLAGLQGGHGDRLTTLETRANHTEGRLSILAQLLRIVAAKAGKACAEVVERIDKGV